MYAKDGSGRCVWIDAAKGIGISLVVLGHMNIPEPVRQYIYCFHVPLFFFLSGLLHRRRSLRELAARRVRTLLIPYVLFSIVGLTLYSVMGVYPAGDHARELTGIVYGTASSAHGVPIQPQWFLLCLFSTEVVFGAILLMGGGRRLAIFATVATIAAVGFVNGRTLQLVLPWGVSISLVAVLFYYLGYCFRAVAPVCLAMKTRTKIGAAIMLGVVVFAVSRVNGRVDMVYNQYGSIPVFLLGATAGTAMIVLLSMVMERACHSQGSAIASGAADCARTSRLLTRLTAGVMACLLYAGRNTLIILPTHILVGRFTSHYLSALSFTSGPVLYELVEKSIMVLLLITSIEVFRRCPLVVPRERPRAERQVLRACQPHFAKL
jgi:acyltransferase